MIADVGRVALTLAAGLMGGLVFMALHLPAPWLSGGLVGAAVLSVAGVQPNMPAAFRDFGMLLAGAITGSAITPEMVAAIARYPASFAILGATTLAITLTGRWVLVRGFGWDRQSALFASVPGALSSVIATVAGARGDMMRVVAVQTFRMFVLVALLPSVVLVTVRETAAPPPAPVLPAGDFAMMLLAGLAIALVLERLEVMAPLLLGGMAAAGGMHGTNVIAGAPPEIISQLAMGLVGIFAGSRLPELNGRALRALLLPAVSLLLATTGIAMLGGVAAAMLLRIPVAEALVAYAPGGLEAMVMLGLAMGLDPLYVSSHHIIRFVMISAALPLLGRRLRG